MLVPRALEYFVAILELGHLNQAAEKLHVSPQAVSKAIAKLEADVGVRLFDRTNFGLTPTAYARALEKYARTVVAETRLARSELLALSGGGGGNLTVGVGRALAARIVPQAIAEFIQARTRISIRITVDISRVLYRQLLVGEVDFVVSAPPTSLEVDPEILQEGLFLERDTPIVAADHPLAASRDLSLQALQKWPWVAIGKDENSWAEICQVFASAGVEPPRKVVLVDSLVLSAGLLSHGGCVVVGGMQDFGVELAMGRLKALPVAELTKERVASIAYRRSTTLLPAAEMLMKHIRVVCRQLGLPAPQTA